MSSIMSHGASDLVKQAPKQQNADVSNLQNVQNAQNADAATETNAQASLNAARGNKSSISFGDTQPTEKTSVKVHHAPGGKSNLSLGWN